MSVVTEKKCIARPFLKWAGGKGQLLKEIEKRLPKKEILADKIDTYVEPFVGGGAVFFYIAQKYPELKHFYLFDINKDLVKCYNTIRNSPTRLISELNFLHTEYIKRDETQREEFYYEIRGEFNLH